MIRASVRDIEVIWLVYDRQLSLTFRHVIIENTFEL